MKMIDMESLQVTLTSTQIDLSSFYTWKILTSNKKVCTVIWEQFLKRRQEIKNPDYIFLPVRIWTPFQVHDRDMESFLSL